MENSIAQKFNGRSLIQFTLPSIIMMLFVSVYSMMGSILSANYISQNALSAINIVFPFISVVLAVSIMFATGGNAIIASNLGEQDMDKARQNFTVVFITVTIVSIAFMLIAIIFCDTIIQFLGSTPQLDKYASTYLKSYALLFPLLFWNVLSEYFFVTIGKPIFGLICVSIGGVLCIATSFLLVAVFNIGIIGAVIGTGIAYLIPAITFVLYFTFKKDCVLHFVKPKIHKNFILDTCTNGSSEMVTNLAIAITTAVMNLIMKNLAGEDGIAAVSVIVQVQFLLGSMYIGYGAGVAPIFAYAHGENNIAQTKKVFGLSLKFVGVSSVILVLLCNIFSNQIVGAFIDPQSPAFSLAKTGFTIFSFGYLVAGFNIFASVFFTSVSNGKISALISFSRTFVFILGMLIVLPQFLGTTGVWLAIPIAEFLAIVVSVLLLRKYKKVYHY